MFNSATFTGPARFEGATFNGTARFNSTTFTRDALFNRAPSPAQFLSEDAAFTGAAPVPTAPLLPVPPGFEGDFPKEVSFKNARFGRGRADFSLEPSNGSRSSMAQRSQGRQISTQQPANAPSAYRAPTLSAFQTFIQAHFEEAPRLDSVQVAQPQNLQALNPNTARDLFARWRALKRLAVEALDTDRELEFNAQEIRAERAVSRWPLPVAPVDWKIWLRSSSGFLYGLFSDYGRSLVRPFATWVVVMLAFASFYLSQTDLVQRDLGLRDTWWGSAAAQTGHYAVANAVPCYAPTDERPADPKETKSDGLSEKLRRQTNAGAEALNLAFRNALVAIDGGSDASYRIYGCLYGVENKTPIVPSAVSTASAIQKLISGILIFLFGLALRNMLKVK